MNKNETFNALGSLIRKNPDVIYKGFEREKDALKYVDSIRKKGVTDIDIITSPNNKKWYVIYSF